MEYNGLVCVYSEWRHGHGSKLKIIKKVDVTNGTKPNQYKIIN